MPTRYHAARSLVILFALAASQVVSACAGGNDEPVDIPIGVATQGPTSAAPTSTGSGLTPTVVGSGSTVVASPSPSPASEPATSTPTTIPQPGGASTSVPQPTPAPRASAVSLTLRAANLAFDKTAVRVPVGATITATMQNDDIGQEHNLTFGLPGLPHGETCKGPCTATQVFRVDTAGSYFFLCTIHDMSGTFTVDP